MPFSRFSNVICASVLTVAAAITGSGRESDAPPARVLPGNRFLVADRIREHLPITTMNLVVNWRTEVAGR